MSDSMSEIASDIHQHNIDIANREIYLYNFNAVDENPGVDYRMAQNFIKNVRILDSISHDDILIHMHSVGGSWFDGMAIFDAIKMSKSHATILVYGQAESMSGIILQAADHRVMAPNAYFMSHYGSQSFDGDYLSYQNLQKFEQKNAETMFNIYAERCVKGQFFKNLFKKNITPSKVKDYLKEQLKNGDWYVSAREAVNYGFADEVKEYE
jgi:ATP-dependent protease ClpP protease subunit